MVKLGICSITFRKLSVENLIQEVKKAGLDAIEWGSDVHVLPGDEERAKEVAQLMDEAGLESSSYGSYYRVGIENDNSFEDILKTAVILKAQDIRVWAGRKGSADADQEYREAVVKDSQRIAKLAAEEGIRVSYEYHRKTLTDTIDSTLDLLKEVDQENVALYWQPAIGLEKAERLKNIKAIGKYITNVHVFKWQEIDRLALAEGIDEWVDYAEKIDKLNENSNEPYYLLEFVKEDSLKQFHSDAESLKTIFEKAEIKK